MIYYYIKGKPYIRTFNNIPPDIEQYKDIMLFNEVQTAYYLEHPTATLREVLHYAGASYEQLLNEAITKKLKQISAYDSSNEVNAFYINNQMMWLPKATRASLSFSLTAEEEAGETTTEIWYKDLSFTLPIATVKQILNAIEIYAKKCFNVTNKHMQEVKRLDTIEAVENYNYKKDYPDKLRFITE